jgi:hypothetical protein
LTSVAPIMIEALLWIYSSRAKLTQALLNGNTKCRWSITHAMIGKMRWLQNRAHWWFQMQEDVVAREAVTQTSGRQSVAGTKHTVSSNVATAGHGRGYI